MEYLKWIDLIWIIVYSFLLGMWGSAIILTIIGTLRFSPILFFSIVNIILLINHIGEIKERLILSDKNQKESEVKE